MPAIDVTKAPFFIRGTTTVLWVPTLAAADYAAATRAEIDGALDLSPDLTAIGGMQLQSGTIPIPTLATKFDATIDGTDTVDASSLTFVDRLTPAAGGTSNPVRSTLAKGSVGYLLVLPYGDIPTYRMEIWPSKVLGLNDARDMASFGQYVAGLSFYAPPNQLAVIPA